MSNETSTNVSQNILKGLPIQLNWMCLQFEDKQTTLPLKTQAFKDVLKNFDRQELTIDIFCDLEWYKTKIVAHAGKIFFR